MVGHGQHGPDQPKTRITAFNEGQYDVLLATTIVEKRARYPAGQHLRPLRRHSSAWPSFTTSEMG